MAKKSGKGGFDEVIRKLMKSHALKEEYVKKVISEKMLEILQKGRALSNQSLVDKAQMALSKDGYSLARTELLNCVWGLLHNPNVGLTPNLKFKWIHGKKKEKTVK